MIELEMQVLQALWKLVPAEVPGLGAYNTSDERLAEELATDVARVRLVLRSLRQERLVSAHEVLGSRDIPDVWLTADGMAAAAAQEPHYENDRTAVADALVVNGTMSCSALSAALDLTPRLVVAALLDLAAGGGIALFPGSDDLTSAGVRPGMARYLR